MTNILNGFAQPLFEESVVRNNLAKARLWLGLGADPNVKLAKPLLSKVAQEGHLEMVELLIGGGANVNAVDSEGDTALMHALRGTDIVTTRAVKAATGGLEGRATAVAKAWIPSAGGSKQSPADKTTTWVLDGGGNVGDKGLTVGERKLPPAAGAIVSSLLAAGANPNIASKGALTYRQTPIMVAAIWGELPIIQRLLKAKAQVNAFDSDGETVLMYAAAEGTRAIVSAMIAAGAALDMQNGHGATALHVAAQYNQADAIGELLAAGAQRSLVDKKGATPLDVATGMRNPAAVKALLPPKPPGQAKLV